MSVQCERAARRAGGAAMGLFERYLTVWVLACMAAGVALGHAFPGAVRPLASLEVARVNLPVAALVWLMIVPMLLKVDLRALGGVARHWRGVAVTLAVNWLVKPFSMALLAWLLLGGLFRAWLPAGQVEQYVAGLVILAAAPCTAMVFVWSHLSRGEPHFTLTQVALNDVVMVFAFAPIVGLLLGLSSVAVPWGTLLLSVAVYIVLPLAVAAAWRRWLLARPHGWLRLQRVLRRLHPLSLAALLATLVLLFAFQGGQIVRQPFVIALLAVPILLQVLLNAGLAYLLNRAVRSPHCVAGPSALIGASNFFELAVATAIALFGLESGAALATVVGVLVEVPVMLLAVAFVNRTRAWYEARPGIVPHERCCPPAPWTCGAP